MSGQDEQTTDNASTSLEGEMQGLKLQNEVQSTEQSQQAQEEQPQEQQTTDQQSQEEQAEHSQEFAIQHPLQTPWTLWYDHQPAVDRTQTRDKKAKVEQWVSNLRQIFTFTTVEEFWSVINNIQGPGFLEPSSDYHLFREGIKPEWEDPANLKGGKWIATLKKSVPKQLLDQYWLFTALALIGETFSEMDEVCGCVVSVRRQNYRLALWLRTDNKDTAISLGQQLKQQLEWGPDIKLEFQSNADAMKRQSSFSNKAKYII